MVAGLVDDVRGGVLRVAEAAPASATMAAMVVMTTRGAAEARITKVVFIAIVARFVRGLS